MTRPDASALLAAALSLAAACRPSPPPPTVRVDPRPAPAVLARAAALDAAPSAIANDPIDAAFPSDDGALAREPAPVDAAAPLDAVARAACPAPRARDADLCAALRAVRAAAATYWSTTECGPAAVGAGSTLSLPGAPCRVLHEAGTQGAAATHTLACTLPWPGGAQPFSERNRRATTAALARFRAATERCFRGVFVEDLEGGPGPGGRFELPIGDEGETIRCDVQWDTATLSGELACTRWEYPEAAGDAGAD